MERLELWDNMEYTVEEITSSWIVSDDFNVILHEEERLGGLPVMNQEAIDFAQCLGAYNVMELDLFGSAYT